MAAQVHIAGVLFGAAGALPDARVHIAGVTFLPAVAAPVARVHITEVGFFPAPATPIPGVGFVYMYDGTTLRRAYPYVWDGADLVAT